MERSYLEKKIYSGSTNKWLNQGKSEESIGISTVLISLIERKKKMPRIVDFVKIANGLSVYPNIPLGYLIWKIR